MTHSAYIYDAVRTPRSRGRSDGSLHGVKPVELAAGLLRALQTRLHLDTAHVNDVIMGCVTAVAEQGSCIGKTIAMQAGWSESVAGLQLDRYCGSALEAVNIGAMKILAGWEQLVVAGGVESMSRVPMGSNGGAAAIDPEVVLSGHIVAQGVSADAIATLGGWSREDVDEYAYSSQQRAAIALKAGYFARSVVPVLDRVGGLILAEDDYPKPQTTMEGLAGLKPSFEKAGGAGHDDMLISKYPQLSRISHVHTPGSSSGIVDGASAVLIGNEQVGRDLGLTPRGRIVAGAVVGTDPTLMLVGPGPAALKVMKTAGLTVKDIDLFEVNEAFSSVVLRFMQDLGVSREIVNVNGGSIAFGHPLGATGGMLVSTLLDELGRRNLRRGLIAFCVGGGMGVATIIERL